MRMEELAYIAYEGKTIEKMRSAEPSFDQMARQVHKLFENFMIKWISTQACELPSPRQLLG